MDEKEKVERVLPGGVLKKRKGDEYDDGSSDKIQSEKKKAKVKCEIKGEPKDLSDASASDSDIENIVSNDNKCNNLLFLR